MTEKKKKKEKQHHQHALFIQFQLNVDCSLTSLVLIYAASLPVPGPAALESTHQKQ